MVRWGMNRWSRFLNLILPVIALFYLLVSGLMSVYSLGEEEELEIEEEEQKGPDLKLASRRDMYSICQSVGLG